MNLYVYCVRSPTAALFHFAQSMDQSRVEPSERSTCEPASKRADYTAQRVKRLLSHSIERPNGHGKATEAMARHCKALQVTISSNRLIYCDICDFSRPCEHRLVRSHWSKHLLASCTSCSKVYRQPSAVLQKSRHRPRMLEFRRYSPEGDFLNCMALLQYLQYCFFAKNGRCTKAK